MPGPERYVLSGCSSGGKSTLLAELARRGFVTVEEPGRVIVREEQERGGDAIPWINARAFADRALKMSIEAFDAMSAHEGPVFFDRSFIDIVSYLSHLNGGLDVYFENLIREKRYADLVFVVPPWPEIFVNDAERQSGFDAAVENYDRLIESYKTYGYSLEMLPKISVSERADILVTLL